MRMTKRKKLIIRIFALLMAAVLLFGTFGLMSGLVFGAESGTTTQSGASQGGIQAPAGPKYTANPEKGKSERRGLWLAYCDFYLLGLSDRTEAQFTTRVRAILSEAKKYGVNTIYFHVRAFDDAAWKSKTFPASKFLDSDASRSKTAAKTYSYDPLAILVREAHAKKMELHAYMNPYRVSHNYYWNPADEKAIDRLLIAVKEVMAYGVDGIHFDDYFYHAKKGYYKCGDPAAVNGKPKGVSVKPSAATKRKNVNKMVKAVYNTVHSRAKCSFGISPAGNWENCMKDGADVATWLSKTGYVDYLAPQIYWTDQWGGGGTKMFTQRLNDFKEKNKAKIPMYVGLALYRTGYFQYDDKGWGWKSSNLASQLKKLRKKDMKGWILFSAAYLFNSQCKKELKNLRKVIFPIKASGVTTPTAMMRGTAASYKGTVKCGVKLKRVEVGIVNKSGKKYVKGHYYKKNVNAKSFDLAKAQKKISIKTLPPGTYYYRVWAHNSLGVSKRLINKKFVIRSDVSKKGVAKPGKLKKGENFTLTGTLHSSGTIKKVEAGVVSKESGRWTKQRYVKTGLGTQSFDLAQADAKVNFAKLDKGVYYYRIWVHTERGPLRVLNHRFSVK